MKYFAYFFAILFLLFSFSLFVSTTEAQIPTTVPTPATTSSPGQTVAANSTDVDFSIDPAPQDITEATKSVKVTFNNLTAGADDYVICTGNKACLGSVGFSKKSLPENSIKKDNIPDANEDASITITLCGDGKNKVKTDCDGSEYFWGGNIYMFSIGSENDDNYIPEKNGAFYVSRLYPTVKVDPSSGLTTNTKSIKVTLGGQPKGGGEKRNNYQITMTGAGGYDKEECVTVGTENTVEFSEFKRVGKYTIFVKEQVDEPETAGSAAKKAGGGLLDKINPIDDIKDAISDPLGAAGGALSNLSPIGQIKKAVNTTKDIISIGEGIDRTISNRCQGGFSYYQITCEFTNPNKGGGTCTKPEDGKDPKGEEYRAFLKDLALLNSAIPGASFPCNDTDGKQTIVNDPGNCKQINTAIGPVEVSVEGFVQTLFRFVLMLAGFGAVLIIIYSGYLLMISRGDKEKIAAARETITAAVVGLLFIILSIVILEVIGIDLLKIPGLTR